MDIYSIFKQTERELVSSGERQPIFGSKSSEETVNKTMDKTLVLLWSQLGDFDNLEYAWWLIRESQQLQAAGITIKANIRMGITDFNNLPTSNGF